MNSQDGANPTILILEDTQEHLAQLEGILAKEGYRILGHKKPGSAIKALVRNEVALVILDIRLAGKDRFDLCETFKAEKAVPELFISQSPDPAARAKAFEAGDDDYITKPFHEPEVLARVKAVLDSFWSMSKNH